MKKHIAVRMRLAPCLYFVRLLPTADYVELDIQIMERNGLHYAGDILGDSEHAAEHQFQPPISFPAIYADVIFLKIAVQKETSLILVSFYMFQYLIALPQNGITFPIQIFFTPVHEPP